MTTSAQPASPSTPTTNRYPGRCHVCSRQIAAGKGRLVRDRTAARPRWVVECYSHDVRPVAGGHDGEAPRASTSTSASTSARPYVTIEAACAAVRLYARLVREGQPGAAVLGELARLAVWAIAEREGADDPSVAPAVELVAAADAALARRHGGEPASRRSERDDAAASIVDEILGTPATGATALPEPVASAPTVVAAEPERRPVPRRPAWTKRGQGGATAAE